MHRLIITYKQRHLVLLILVSLIIKLLLLPYFTDVYFESSRMMTQYNLAANLADFDGLYLDEQFIAKASAYIYDHHRNIDYKILTTIIPSSNNLNKSPEINDAWGYAVLLGMIWKITGDKSYLYIQVIQILIDMFAALAIFYIVYHLFKRIKLAFFIAFCYAGFIPFIFMSIIANRDYYAAWGLIFSLFFLLSGLAKKKLLINFILAGVIIALTSWFRPTIFLIPFIFSIYSFLLKETLRNRLILSIKTFCYVGFPIFLLFILPFSLQYHAKYGNYNFTQTMSGLMLWSGLGEYPNKYHFICNDGAAAERAISLGYPKDAPYGTARFNQLLKEDAMSVIRKDPLFYLSTVVRRYIDAVFLNLHIGFSEKNNISYKKLQLSMFDFLKTYPFLFLEKLIKKILQYGLIILLIAALFLYKKQYKALLLLLLIWQYKIFIHIPTHLEERFIMEGYFPVVILAGLTIYSLLKRIKKNRQHLIPIKFKRGGTR